MEELSIELLIRLNTLGLRVKYLRRQKEWTQEQLAIECGSTQGVIQKIENGKSLQPRIIMQLARALEVDAQWLQFGCLHNDPVLQYAVNRIVSKKMPGPDFHSTMRAMRETVAELSHLERK